MALSQTDAKKVAAQVAEMMGGLTKDKYDWLNRARIAQVAGWTEKVNVALQRYTSQGPWTAAKRFSDAGVYYNVPVWDMMDPSGWIHQKAGGGDYTVELTHPEEPNLGILYGFKVNVEGAPRTPEAIRQAELESTSKDQDIAGKVAEQFRAAGMDAQTSLTQATKLVRENPAAAQMMVSSPKAREEDEDMQLLRFMMMRDAMASGKPNGAGDETLRELAKMQAKLERQEAEAKATEERRRQEDAHRAEMDRMRDEMRALKEASKAPKVSPAESWAPLVAALAPIGAALVQNMQAQRDSEQARQAANFQAQLQFFTSQAEQSKAAGDAQAAQAKVQSESLLGMMQHELELAKARSQEPLQQIQAVQGMAAAMGGILNGYAQIALELTKDDTPAWLRSVQEAMRELPGMVMALLQPPQGQTPPPDQYDAQEEAPPGIDEQAAAAVMEPPAGEEAAAVEAGQMPPEQVEAPPPEEKAGPTEEDFDDEEKAMVNAALEKIDIAELESYFRRRLTWWPVLMKVGSGDPRMIGRAIAEKAVAEKDAGQLPEEGEIILADPGGFAEYLQTRFKLKKAYVKQMIAGFEEWLAENNIEISVQKPPEPAENA